jgi:thiamine-monophosphate kinase
MRDAAGALGVNPYLWLLAGGEDHAPAATFPPDADLSPEWRVIGSVHKGTGVTVDRNPDRRHRVGSLRVRPDVSGGTH